MERHRVFGLEGLDGTGKSTAGKMLAEETSSRYVYFMDQNRLSCLRRYFDHAPTKLRFLYYVAAAIENYRFVERVRKLSDTFVDRTIFSTIAYHRGYGLPEVYTTFVPRFLFDQFDRMIFFHATDNERQRRLESRNADNSDATSRRSDDRSIVSANSIDVEYRKVLPQGTIFIDTNCKSPRQVVDEIREQI